MQCGRGSACKRQLGRISLLTAKEVVLCCVLAVNVMQLRDCATLQLGNEGRMGWYDMSWLHVREWQMAFGNTKTAFAAVESFERSGIERLAVFDS